MTRVHTYALGACIATASCGTNVVDGNPFCVSAVKKTGVHPPTGAVVTIRVGQFWPRGCVCLHPNDRALAEAVLDGTQAPNQEFDNILSDAAGRAEFACLDEAIPRGLVNIKCDIDLSCLPNNHISILDLQTCAAFPENYYETAASSAGGATGGTGSEPCSGGPSIATGQINTTGFGFEPTGSYPSPYTMDDAVDCPTNALCFVDETFVAELATTPSLIENDNAQIEFSVDGLELIDVPSGSLADALGFQDGDIVKDVSGFPVTSFDDVREAIVGISYEKMLVNSVTVTYERPPSTKLLKRSIRPSDLASYP